MPNEPKLEKVVPAAEYRGEDDDDHELCTNMQLGAEQYLTEFAWCERVTSAFVGICIGGVVGVFLFRIIPRADADEWIWVVCGDLPPAYLTVDDAPTPAAALDAYIGAMSEWVEAVKDSRSIDGLIPVNAPPTMEYASMLESRLKFLDREILSRYEADLEDC